MKAEEIVDCLDTLVRLGCIRAYTESNHLRPPEDWPQFERFALSKSDLLGTFSVRSFLPLLFFCLLFLFVVLSSAR